MKLWTIAATVAAGVFIHKVWKDDKEKKEEEERRINSWNGFNDNISEYDFIEIVERAKKGIKRLKKLYIDGTIVHGTVRTQSGLSEWHFQIDFNDYGHLTGTYWLSSDNDDSTIPEYVADIISSSIKNFSPKRMSYNFNNRIIGNKQKQDICPNCGKQITVLQAKYCGFCGKALR